MASGDKIREGLVIESLERLNTSANGNPRFRVTFTNGTVAETQSDAALNYGIENREFRDVPLKVTFTRAGKISYAVPQQ